MLNPENYVLANNNDLARSITTCAHPPIPREITQQYKANDVLRGGEASLKRPDVEADAGLLHHLAALVQNLQRWPHLHLPVILQKNHCY